MLLTLRINSLHFAGVGSSRFNSVSRLHSPRRKLCIGSVAVILTMSNLKSCAILGKTILKVVSNEHHSSVL